jgi:hypothetical protein
MVILFLELGSPLENHSVSAGTRLMAQPVGYRVVVGVGVVGVGV